MFVCFFLHLHLHVWVCRSKDVGLFVLVREKWLVNVRRVHVLSIDSTEWILTFNLRGTAQLKAKWWLLPRSSRKSAPGCHTLRCWPGDKGLINLDRNSQQSHLTPVFGQGHSNKHCYCSYLTFYLLGVLQALCSILPIFVTKYFHSFTVKRNVFF